MYIVFRYPGFLGWGVCMFQFQVRNNIRNIQKHLKINITLSNKHIITTFCIIQKSLKHFKIYIHMFFFKLFHSVKQPCSKFWNQHYDWIFQIEKKIVFQQDHFRKGKTPFKVKEKVAYYFTYLVSWFRVAISLVT